MQCLPVLYKIPFKKNSLVPDAFKERLLRKINLQILTYA